MTDEAGPGEQVVIDPFLLQDAAERNGFCFVGYDQKAHTIGSRDSDVELGCRRSGFNINETGKHYWAVTI